MNKNWKRRLLRSIALVLLLITTSLWPETRAEGNGLTIHFLDVGQADAAIVLCDDEVLMIDGGNVEDSSFVYAYLKGTLALDHIDYMIGTHPHEDHIGGLSGALNACTVGTVFSPVTSYDSEEFENFKRYAEKQGTGLTVPSVGDTFTVGGASVEFLAPVHAYENVNDLSLVVRIEYGETSFLFTGDAEGDSEHDMVDLGVDLSADVLKVAHHGSDTSSSYVFLREVMPNYAVISVGAGNAYDHPSLDTLSRLRDVGAVVYRMDQQGTILCKSDGEEITFSTERNIAPDTQSGRVQRPGLETALTDMTGDAPYIGNSNSYKFHYADCSSVEKMNAENKVEFFSREEAISAGYEPCKRCEP